MTANSPDSEDPLKLEEDLTPNVNVTVAIFLVIALFVTCACLFVPYAGIQNDEALFAGPLFQDHPREYKLRAFKHDIPLMLLPYLGSTKTWLYGPIFRLWAPGIWPLRLPVILIGAIFIAVLFGLVRRISGAGVALATCVLIATDPLFLLTTTFDWGPVAIQHAAYVAGLLCLITGTQRRSALRIGVGFFFFGLGLWDKALLLWLLSGTALATLILYFAEVRRIFTRRILLAAVLGFVMGSSPLILYNIRQPLKTFRGTTDFTLDNLADRARYLRLCLGGFGLFGYMIGEEWMDHQRPPVTAVERASVAIRYAAGQHRSTLFFYGVVVSLLAAPLWWKRRKPVLFALIAMLAAWLEMALNRETGGGVHHVVLLWPLPQFIVASALLAAVAGLPRYRRAAAALLIGGLAVSNALVVNQYFSQVVRAGAVGGWTDAIFPLSDHLRKTTHGPIFTADWGMMDGLALLMRGQRVFGSADSVLVKEPDQRTRAVIEWMLSHPTPTFVTHTEGNEFTAGAARRLREVAESLGWRQRVEAVIRDSNGRPIFEVLTFTKRAGT